MGFIDRVTARARNDEVMRADPVSLEEFGRLFDGQHGVSTAGVHVTTNAALSVSAWYRGVRYLSETMASLPVHGYRDRPEGRERRTRPAWMRHPASEIPWFGIVEFQMVSLLHRGNSFAYKDRGPSGQVVGLLPLHPDRMKFGVHNGHKVFNYRAGDGEEFAFTTREVLHIPALSTDGYFGIDPIRAFAAPLGSVIAADRYAAKSFANESRLAAYISLPGRMENEEAERIYKQWERLHTGMDARRFGVIGDGATYNTIGLDPQQTQLLESRKFGVTEVARMLGVVPHKLYDLERSTFSNIEHQAIEAVTDGIRPWASRFEAWINYDPHLTVPGSFIEFELEGLLRGDTATRFEAYSKATGVPWAGINYPRRLENLPPIPGGDLPASPLNMATEPNEGDTDNGQA